MRAPVFLSLDDIYCTNKASSCRRKKVVNIERQGWKENKEKTKEIVAKTSDGQRYPLPPYESVCECEVVRGAVAPKGPMTYAVFIAAGI